MQKRRVDGEEYWLYRGRWVPRRHFYDYGEEPIYMGPSRRDSAGSALFGFAACCLVGGYIIGKLLLGISDAVKISVTVPQPSGVIWDDPFWGMEALTG